MESFMTRKIICYLILLSPIVMAQSNINPDISLIGTFDTYTNFIKDSPDYGKLIFDVPSFELFIDGYLNPYARAAANISFEDGAFGVEELYAQILRGLPLDMQIKAGKYLLGFGKLNTVHPHAWPFIDRPLWQQIYFSDEGFNDIGLDVNFILPTENFYSSLDLGVYTGNSMAINTAGEDADPYEVRGNNLIFVGRLGSFFSLNDFNFLDVGLSGSFGNYAKSSFYVPDSIGYPQQMLKYFYGGIDFKYKYKPDGYTSLVIQGEGILNNRDVIRGTESKPVVETITTYGAFIYLDYQFIKQFSIGAKYDFTFGVIGDDYSASTLSNDGSNKTSGIEGWLGYYPVEETLAFRLSTQYLFFNLADNMTKDGETTITLQMIFSLGPHKAHQF
jgi:hypothetical protein